MGNMLKTVTLKTIFRENEKAEGKNLHKIG